MSIDFKGIDKAALPYLKELAQRWAPNGEFSGDEYVPLNPKRTDGNPGSFKINVRTGVWKEFAEANTRGGGAISLYAYLHGVKNGEAARAIAKLIGREDLAPEFQKAKFSNKELIPVIPALPDAPPPPSDLVFKRKKEAMRFEYRDAENRIIGYIVRVQSAPDGSDKEFCPLVYCRAPDGTYLWGWKSFPKPRPLYGLRELAEYPEATVIVVEGEKAARALRPIQHERGNVVVTWPGGAMAVKHVDWNPLRGRNVLLWPDNDEPGFGAMRMVWHEIQSKAEAVMAALPPKDKPLGWDAYDAIDEGMTALQMQEQLTLVDEIQALRREDSSPVVPAEGSPLDGAGQGNIGAPLLSSFGAGSPLMALGFDRGTYYYLPQGQSQVVPLAAATHSDKYLIAMAPLSWWEREFPSAKGSVAWKQAMNAMFRACEARGVFNPDILRGRGAWRSDHGKTVLHLGDQLLIDGKRVTLQEGSNGHIYEKKQAVPFNAAEPLSNTDSQKLLQLCKLLRWENPLSGYLLAGFCAVAPVCGALDWRPHIWINGERGGGKTWVLREIVAKAVSQNRSLLISGATTEAFVRQTLQTDAFPVLFDESEAQTKLGRERLQSMLELIRGSSSEGSGNVGKGSPTGKALKYSIRSCFAMASIYVNMVEAADFSRTSILTIRADKSQTDEEFEQIRALAKQLTPEYADMLLLRSLKLLSTIRQSAQVFGQVLREKKLGDQRFADQNGTLLAGAWSLASTEPVSHERAREFVAEMDWEEYRSDTDEKDGLRCLRALMNLKIRVEDNGKRVVERQIGELIAVAGDITDDDSISIEKAEENLARNAIRVINGSIVIPGRAPVISNLFKDTSFEVAWPKLLRQVPGAEAVDNPVRFAALGDKKRNKVRAISLDMKDALNLLL